MRWDALRSPGPEGTQAPLQAARAVPLLPLALAGGVRRTFDTPGFAGMTFYEVQAKSLINKVPSASQVPFQWTINPYRGCSHACTYCLAGDTPILMADGRTKPLSAIRVGDAIYGTRDGRYVITTVLAHWQTVKRAYRVRLEDGSEMVASGDHRFLADHGWAFVTRGRQRQYLTRRSTLMGIGSLATPPQETAAYRQGYLCGMIRSDAKIGSYEYQYGGVVRGFRLTLADSAAMSRTQRYLAAFDITVAPFSGRSLGAGAPRRSVHGIRTSSAEDVASISALIDWPDSPGRDWTAGFLAGTFDADGVYGPDGLGIATRDQQMVDRIVAACLFIGLAVTIEGPGPGEIYQV
ncbi:MAG TPA: radical SAM protein, partial [Micromonosporaceae bacterium]